MNNVDSIEGKMIEEYRLNRFREMDTNLEKDIRKHSSCISKYKKLNRTIEIIIHILNVVNILSTGGTVGTSGIGLYSATIPCATISSFVTLGNATFQILLKKIMKKQKKKTFPGFITCASHSKQVKKIDK